MEFKKFGNRYFVRIDRGEELIESLKKFCRANGIKLASVTGIGAAGKAVIGLFETKTKKYISKEVTGDHEITALMGNITRMDGEPYLHIHVNLADRECRAIGGHLNSAVISGTCEGVVDVTDGALGREFDGGAGLNLLKF